ncbi:BAF_collapsed_G0057950.mRNA.1.CDS.1 [Saccharomyces cerevisiae]|nr:BAF_HP2_G0056670.mRNA.1.CDS.1 [Saccharomyces cerevisiae]CAI6808348.1 BAF_HP2_G0056670.mRNA.1.CDS.1 [Saccharomyces cerevisiae]CAI6837388.1 BAF_HP1_G0056730.mRNA.1.CDS.1 [Saccharomyces cerevisiae]CAI7402076.1 BAF_collapsed_G0057950.mRNA.1.CDS.1 [Saccharomyces cerevisiae]
MSMLPWSQIRDVSKLLLGFMLFIISIQKIASILMSWILMLRHSTIRKISFGYFFGTSIRRAFILTDFAQIYIGKITLRIGWKPGIVFHNVDLKLFGKDSHITAHSTKDSRTYFNPRDQTFTFVINRRVLSILKLVFSFSTFFHTLALTVPNGKQYKLNIGSITISHPHDDTIKLEAFLHDFTHPETKDTLNHTGFFMVCKIGKEDDTGSNCTKVILKNWKSSLKISDVCWHLPEKKGKNLHTEPVEPFSAGDDAEMLTSYRKMLKPFHYPLKTLNILDLKVENVKLIYKKKFTIRISSAQLYLESISILNNVSALELLPLNKPTWGDFELSLSANAVVVDIDGNTAVRIPFGNVILTSDILLFLLDNVPLQRTKVSSILNIINPSVFLTIHQVLEVLHLVDKFDSPETSSCTNTNDRSLNILDLDIDRLPSFNFELLMSNFISRLHISDEENVTFKVFSTHALFSRNNLSMTPKKGQVMQIRPDWPFAKTALVSDQLSNYIKIVGTSLSYLRIPTEQDANPVSIPVCGFERLDTFLDEFTNSKLIVQSTLRHSYVSLENIEVLHTLSRAFDKIYLLISSRTKRNAAHKANGGKLGDLNEAKKTFNWSLKLRMKDISCSLLVAGFLPKNLDPVEAENFNLSDVTRGAKVVFTESILLADSQEKNFTIIDASVYRFMDGTTYKPSPEVIIQFTNLLLSFNDSDEIHFSLPKIKFKMDVNIIWLWFYIRSIWIKFRPNSKLSRNSVSSVKSVNVLDRLRVDIGKMIIELTLPHNTEVLLIFERIGLSSSTKNLTIASLSAYVVSVYVKHIKVYVSLLNINDFELDTEELICKKSAVINTSLIHFHAEYHFRFYMITDNIVTLYKSFKQIKLAFSNLNEFKRLYPQQQFPKKVPNLHICCQDFLIDIEEDPFEQELGLILKVGVLEQRERLKKLEEFKEKLSTYEDMNVRLRSLYDTSRGQSFFPEFYANDQEYEQKAYLRLLENFSTSWIARYRKAKLSFYGMPYRVVSREELGTKYHLFTRQKTSTVANLVVKDLDFKLGSPSFPLDNYMDFVYQYGKKVPKSTEYTLLIILGLKIKSALWELRLRDYPIPAISFPDTFTTGDVVFAEKMPAPCALHTVYVPFVSSAQRSPYNDANTIYGSHIIRTINSVKTYFNIRSMVTSSSSARITWGKSLQPGYESLMLWFDFLTKPLIDPSKKLGFWDKFRYLVHGKWIYEFSEESEIHLNIKGSHDPYKITDDGAGLAFCWSGGTTIYVHNSTDPKEFLKIESQRFQLAVPDFAKVSKFDKVFMKLDGRVIWTLGLLFEQGDISKAGDEERFLPNRPHYEIQLMNPDGVADLDHHDTYKGFRTSFIHMSFGVYSSEHGSINSLYLAPYALTHFFKWWNLFHTYTSGPIRQGRLFTDVLQNKTKFGRSLFTIAYQLHLKRLMVTHIYRHITTQYDLEKDRKITFTGLKGRFDSLKIDLHQKRVKLTHTNQKLNKSKPVWKFKMSRGEIDCAEADIRILSTLFDQEAVKEILTSGLDGILEDEPSRPISPQDVEYLRESDWYDYEDYIDLNQVPLGSSLPLKLEAIPLLYSPRISYFRKINDDGYVLAYPFGTEESHNCLIGKNHPELTQEKLATERKREIEEQLKLLHITLSELQSNKGGGSVSGNSERYARELKAEVAELNHRLHTVNTILSDLKISETIPGGNTDGDSSSSLSDTDVNLENAPPIQNRISLLRTNTVESFVSMRKASTMQVESTYDNRFMVHNIELKIDNKIRHHLLEYASSAFERKSMRFAVTYKSVTILKELLGNVLTGVRTSVEDYGSILEDGLASNSEFIEHFEKLIREVPSDDFDYVDNYLFRLISPQVQIKSDVERNAAVILAARDIEMGIIDIVQVYGKSGKRIPVDVDTIVETRYSAVSKDIQLFTLFKKDLEGPEGRFFHKNGYGSDKESDIWPPWIPLEMCFDGSLLDKHVFLKRRSMFLTYVAPNPLFFSANDTSAFSYDSRFRIAFPGLVLTSDCQQYCAVYAIAEDLLSFGSSLDEKVEKLSRILFTDEVRNNLENLDVSVVTALQERIKELYYTRAYLKLHEPRLFMKSGQELTFDIQTSTLKLTLLMTAIKKTYDRMGSGNRVIQKRLRWQVGTDELIWELYDESKTPFVTIGLGPSTFIRSETSDGTNSNKVSISSLQCFNQQENPVYTELLAPFYENSSYNKNAPMVEIFWILGPSVGGISDLQDLIVSLQPLIFKMDHKTSEKLMNYLFPKIEQTSIEPNSPELVPRSSTSSFFSSSPVLRHSLSNGSLSVYDAKDVDSWDLRSIQSKEGIKKHKGDHRKLSASLFVQPDYNINEMVKRSGTFFNVKSIIIRKTLMSVCYKGSHSLLTDVNNLIVRVPVLKYHNKLWSREEFFTALKRDVVRIVLQHLGNIIGNKFLPHKKENKKKTSMEIHRLLSPDSQNRDNSHILEVEGHNSFYSSTHSSDIRSINSDETYNENDGNGVKPFYPVTSEFSKNK